MKSRLSITAAAIAMFALPSMATAQVIFSETFDDPSSAAKFATTSFSLTDGGAGTPDVYSEFAFDYSATGSSRLTQSIGAAPNGGSSTGLVLAANLAGNNRSSINLFPILSGQGFNLDPTTNLPVTDSNYKMTFDFWGGVNTVSGTTEFLQVGAQSNGDGQHMNGFGEASPDSDFFEINIAGDLGSSDYIRFTTIVDPTQFGGFIAHSDPTPVAALPNPPYDYQAEGGAPAYNWVEAEIRHEDGISTLAFNGVDITTIEFGDFGNDLGVEGMPWFGYEDFFNSQAGGDSSLVADAGGSGSPSGDYNLDGTVDAADYTIWRDTLGDSVTAGEGADGNGNGIIDSLDYDEWVANYGTTGGGTGSSFDPFDANFIVIDNLVVELLPAASAASSVPEPSSLLLIGLGLIGMARRRS